MGSVLSTKSTVFLKFQPLRGGLFIFRIRIVFSITVRTCEMNNYSHNTNQPLIYLMRPTPRFLNRINSTIPSHNLKKNPKPTIGIEPMTSSLPRKCSTTELRGHKKLIHLTPQKGGAGNGTRTRDPQLGRLTL